MRSPLRLLATAGILLAVLSACMVPAAARAELEVSVTGSPEGAVDAAILDAAAVVIESRLSEAGIPVVGSTRGDGSVVVRLGDDTTDAELATAQELAAFSSVGGFRPVLLAGLPDDAVDAPAASAEPLDGSDPAWITPAVAERFTAEDCAGVAPPDDGPDVPLVACDADGTIKYVLGPVQVDPGTLASATTQPVSPDDSGQWAVTLEFDAEGTAALAELSTRLIGLPAPRNQFALVLDGRVLSAPLVMAAITDGRPQITGGFDEPTARALAARFVLASAAVVTRVERLELLE